VPQTRKELEKANKKEKKQKPLSKQQFSSGHGSSAKKQKTNYITKSNNKEGNNKTRKEICGVWFFLNFSQVFGSTIHFHFFSFFFFFTTFISLGE